MKKVAVILFNLGGPDRPDSVKPFLFNLFHDRAIIGLPQPLRYVVARLISSRRAPIAREIYAKLGGGSPIVQNTEAQARALEQALNETPETVYRCFIAMRYWHPFVHETIEHVQKFGADEIVLLPLYPQFSTTTTGSSFEDWRRAARKHGLAVPTKSVCCYPVQEGFIAALAERTRQAFMEASAFGVPRVLFSAHGLPKKIVSAGDPYQAQCEMTVASIRSKLGAAISDCVLCYQSRVGPLEWIGPATDQEVRRAGREGKPLVVVPVAFVSDHSETLVELDMEYRHLAAQSGVPFYGYVSPVGINPSFIEGLRRVVREAKEPCAPEGGARLCPPDFTGCICKVPAHVV